MKSLRVVSGAQTTLAVITKSCMLFPKNWYPDTQIGAQMRNFL